MLPVSTLLFLGASAPSTFAAAGSRIGKSTYACSKKAATNAYPWEIKYLPVEEADDDCSDRTCTCGIQSRVALKQSSTSGLGAPQGFGIHCTYAGGEDDSRAAANGGTAEAKLEGTIAEAIGDWSTYDTDTNVRAWATYSTVLWADAGLDWYVTQFEADSVDYHVASWSNADGTFWTLLVLIPKTPVVLELMGECTVCGSATERRMPSDYVGWAGARRADPPLTKVGADAVQGYLSATAVSRHVSNLTVVQTFYKDVFGISPVNTSTSADGAKTAFFQPGGDSVSIRYVSYSGLPVAKSPTWFETLLLDAASTYQTSPSSCWPIWGDFHYGGTYGSGTILSHVTAAAKLGYPYRSFNGGAGPNNAYFVEPSGMWIQDGGDPTGLPEAGGFSTSYCYTFCTNASHPLSAFNK